MDGFKGNPNGNHPFGEEDPPKHTNMLQGQNQKSPLGVGTDSHGKVGILDKDSKGALFHKSPLKLTEAN